MTDMWPEAAGEILANLLGDPEPRPGGPYVHTLKLPEPEYDDEGNEIWRMPDPPYTLVERPVADVVREAGFGPVPERIQVTYCTEYCGDACVCSLRTGEP